MTRRQVVPLRSILEGIYDGPHATPSKIDDGPVFLGISSLQGGRLDLSQSAHISEEDFVKWTKRVLPRGNDLVFSYETRLGEAALIPQGLRCCLGRRMGLLRPDLNKVDPRYLLYIFLGPDFQETIRERTVHGSTVDRILLTEIGEFPVRLVAELAEQRSIAAFLGALDDKIELNRAMNRTLEDMAQAIFKSWFIDFDGQPSLTYTAQELLDRNILVIGDGYRAKRAELDEQGMPFARAGNINQGFRFDNAELLGYDGVEQAQKQNKVSQVYDIVFTSKGTVGRFAFVTEGTPRFVYSPQLCFWRSLDTKALNPYFLFYWMCSSGFLHQVAAVKGQTDMAEYVSLRDQRRMSVTVPPAEAQAQLDDRIRPLVMRMAHNMSESQTLAELRDTLLPRLISGEIRIPEAEEAVEHAL